MKADAKKANDGGPAFPVFPDTGSGHGAAFRGMSLRAYFAAAAMGGMLAHDKYDTVGLEKLFAIDAVKYADALIKELGE